jgi:hypothetical protein
MCRVKPRFEEIAAAAWSLPIWSPENVIFERENLDPKLEKRWRIRIRASFSHLLTLGFTAGKNNDVAASRVNL